MEHAQAQLVQRHDQFGTSVTVRYCWIPAQVRVGDRVTLKNSEDPATLWDVAWVSTMKRELADIPRGWHNNI